jgi:molecular chaperone GrpE
MTEKKEKTEINKEIKECEENLECDKKQSHEHGETCAKKKEFEELKDTLQHLQAEFENYKKREELQKKHFQDYCNAQLIESFLPVLDSMNKALEQNTNEEEKKGIELIQKQLIDILKRNGLKEMNSVGKEFDPMLHECISFESNNEKENNIILDELIKGYFFKEKILRHAKVIVNKKEQKQEEKK